ncbi:MAG TPA: hypothetical protein VIN07_03130 [Flavipsychrobacter sp.]
MQRINLLIQKLADLAGSDKDKSVIDTDLMLDYTRVLYADLLELRKNQLLMPVQEDNGQQSSAHVPAQEAESHIAVEEPVVVTANVADVPAIDIRTSIGINDKYLYLSELFMDDKAAYDAAVKHLNTCNSLQEALNYTETELHGKYNWDKENPTVQSFYSLLSNSFPSI